MVKKVKVSKIPKKIERLPSGINGFDKLCEGGFENNSINLIVGSSGSGKTIFTMQFLMGGISRGENVLYVTFEEKKGEFYSNMREFGWTLKKKKNQENLLF